MKSENKVKKESSKTNSLESLTQTAFQIIVHAGGAKTAAMEAIYAAKEGNFKLAKEKIKEANEGVVAAEKEHFSLIQAEARGVRINVPLILMHAEDQILSTQVIILLGEEIIEIHKKLQEKEGSKT